jgi:hypothetical protein
MPSRQEIDISQIASVSRSNPVFCLPSLCALRVLAAIAFGSAVSISAHETQKRTQLTVFRKRLAFVFRMRI